MKPWETERFNDLEREYDSGLCGKESEHPLGMFDVWRSTVCIGDNFFKPVIFLD